MCGSVWKLKMRGMKKILLAAVGAAGLLASCGGGNVIDSGYYGNYNPSAGATLTSLSDYTTNWTYNGTPVICNNASTTISFNVNWNGYLNSVGFQFKGYNTGNYINTNTYAINSSVGSAKANFTLGVNMAPLSVTDQPITSQSIVVNPTTLGYTYVRAQGVDGNGYYTNVIQSDYSIPVMNCQ